MHGLHKAVKCTSKKSSAEKKPSRSALSALTNKLLAQKSRDYTAQVVSKFLNTVKQFNMRLKKVLWKLLNMTCLPAVMSVTFSVMLDARSNSPA